MDLPTEKSKKKTAITDQNWLIYGQPKVGNTPLSSHFPNAIFLPTEDGQKHVEVFKFPLITTWEEVLQALKALNTQEHEYKTLVIDIADRFYKYCEVYVCKKNKVEHPSDLPYGKGFSLVKAELDRVITKINAMGISIVFLSHAKEKEMKSKTATWTCMATSMGGSAEGLIAGLCDIILYCYISSDGKREMMAQPTKHVMAGSRTVKLPGKLPLSYEKLVQHFEGEEE